MLRPIYLHYKALYLTIRRCQKAPSFFLLCDRQSASQSGTGPSSTHVTGTTARSSKHRLSSLYLPSSGLLTLGRESPISPKVANRVPPGPPEHRCSEGRVVNASAQRAEDCLVMALCWMTTSLQSPPTPPLSLPNSVSDRRCHWGKKAAPSGFRDSEPGIRPAFEIDLRQIHAGCS